MANFQKQALSPSTQSSYQSGWSCFLTFCTINCVQFTTRGMPNINEDILLYFVTHCASNLHLSYHTIKLYLCGIRAQYISVMGINPLVQATGLPCHRLKLLLRGIRKQPTTRELQPRLPITQPILFKLCTLLQSSVFGHYMDVLLEAAFCLAFFGFLRCGEFTTTTLIFDPHSNLSIGDIAFTSSDHGQISKMTLTLKTSKTDPFRKGCVLSFFPTARFLCPVRAMQKYLPLRQSMPARLHDPLFLLLPSQVPLTRSVLIEHLRYLLRRLGYNAYHYAGHSFRKGAATSCSDAHIPDHLMKTMGRWSSDCYQRYIHTNVSVIRDAQLLLATSVI